MPVVDFPWTHLSGGSSGVPCLPPRSPGSIRTASSTRMGGSGNAQEYFVAGGIAGVVSRTAIAPIERVKILYQVSRASVSTSWLQLAPRIWREEGFLSFWKGNTAAVTRVLPYMSLTFLSYEEYRAALKSCGLGKTGSTIAAGSAAGVTAVALTYPLDLARSSPSPSPGPSLVPGPSPGHCPGPGPGSSPASWPWPWP